MKRVLIGLLSVGILCAAAPRCTAQAARSAADVRRETFDVVWRTVKDRHFDPTFGGLDWDKVREKYEPRLASLKSDDELYALLQEVLGELGQSHFGVIPPGAAVENEVSAPARGGIGIDVKLIDGQAVITRVAADSTAARAGLRPGFVIREIDGTPVTALIERFAKTKERPATRDFLIARAVVARSGGLPGTSVKLVYLDEKDVRREATVARAALTGEMSPPLGNFGSQYTEFEAKRLAGGIGYIRFNIFVASLMDRIRAAVRSMSDAPGIIFDLRGNPGGLGGMSGGIAGMLMTEQGSLGVTRMRAGNINFAVFPQPNPYQGPVAILIDGGSASTSEIFAAGMQEARRAVIVGETSMGALLLSQIMKLPTGAFFQFAFGDYRTPKGRVVEGRGVTPDVAVRPSRADLLGGRDPQLEAAIAEIQKRAARPAAGLQGNDFSRGATQHAAP